MDVLVRVDADCHRPLHHLASLPSCGRPAWTGPCRAKGTQASIRSPASRAKRRRETGPKEGRAETRQLVCGSSRRRLALSAAHRTTTATPRGYTACFLPQGRQDSNLQPPVLETGALPVELRPSAATMIPAWDGAPSRLSSPS